MLADGVGLKAFCPEKWRHDHVCSGSLGFAEGEIVLNSLIRLHREVQDIQSPWTVHVGHGDNNHKKKPRYNKWHADSEPF
jgi:hypothetical protein